MNNNYKKLYRSSDNRMISGVAAGLGEYIGMDPTVVRLIFAVSSVFLFPLPIIAYFVMMLIIPEEPVRSSNDMV